jgi:RNase P subunit RPR2
MSPEKIQSERIKLLEQGIKLKKKLAKKGSNLSTRDMEEALQFSKKARALNMAAAEKISCASCHGKLTPEQYAYRMEAHPGERMLCTGCAMSM